MLNDDFARSRGIPLRRHAICELLLKKVIEEEIETRAFCSAGFHKIRQVNEIAISLSWYLAQYFNTDDGLTTKTLALIDTEASHTSSNLKDLLLCILY